MSRLRERLIEQYAEHYERINASVIPELDDIRQQSMALQYGELIRPLPTGSRVLDLGCGTGFLLSWLSTQPNLIPVGVDSSAGQIAVARQHLPTVELHHADGLEFLRAHQDTFAGIFCLDVLEHLPGDDLLLDWLEAARDALIPGGFFYCRAPNAANVLGYYSRYIDFTHERSFTRTSMLQVLEAAGLEQCRAVPIQTARVTGRVRQRVEWLLHKFLFRLSGHGLETTFTSNVCAIGFRTR